MGSGGRGMGSGVEEVLWEVGLEWIGNGGRGMGSGGRGMGSGGRGMGIGSRGL